MLTPTNNYKILQQAITELKPELETVQSIVNTIHPNLESVLNDLGPLPPEALFLGIATDDLPVLLNLNDPIPGPINIVTDPGAGKTAFLKSVAYAIARTQQTKNIQFGVITNYPDEWVNLELEDHCLGIFPTYHNSSQEFILSLVSWAHDQNYRSQNLILLIDDLESMTHLDHETQDNIRWLLFRGPNHHVWPIVTQNAERISEVSGWLEYFRTRIFGKTKDKRLLELLSGFSRFNFSILEPGYQFAIRDGRDLLKFWIPSLEEFDHRERGIR